MKFKPGLLVFVIFLLIGCHVEIQQSQLIPSENLSSGSQNAVNTRTSSFGSYSNLTVEVELPKTYQEVAAGDELWFTTRVMNVGSEKRRDITLLYSILDASSQVVSSRSETVAVETQASFVGTIRAPTSLPPGLYFLRVFVQSMTGESFAETTFHITNSESHSTVIIKFSLFDIQVEIPENYKTVQPGDELLTTIKLINVGSGGRIDVFLEYWITDEHGKVLLKEKETVAVETQNNFVRIFDIPATARPGTYHFHARLFYPGVELTPEYTTMFVIERQLSAPLSAAITLFTLATVLFISRNTLKNNFEKELVKRKVRALVRKHGEEKNKLRTP